MPKDNYVRSVSLLDTKPLIIRVKDGDSFIPDLFMGARSAVSFKPTIRVADYSIWELREPGGPEALIAAETSLRTAEAVDVQLLNRMSFERELGYVWVNEVPYGVMMEKLGFPIPRVKQTPIQKLRAAGISFPRRVDQR